MMAKLGQGLGDLVAPRREPVEIWHVSRKWRAFFMSDGLIAEGLVFVIIQVEMIF